MFGVQADASQESLRSSETGFATPESEWWSCDPGDKYVGLTEWFGRNPVASECTNPEAAIYKLIARSDTAKLLVVEGYRLFPHLARQQAGSEFLTTQMIGALRLICALKKIPVYSQTSGQGKLPYSLQPFRSWSKAQWDCPGPGTHARDSRVHGYAFMLKLDKWFPGKDEAFA